MRESEAIRAASDRLWRSAESGQTCEPVRDVLGIKDLNQAYAAQELNTQKKLAAGDRVVGYKIGLTSEAVQKQLGVDQPDFGVLTEKMLVERNTISFDQLMQPKAEAEIAFILSKDITDANITLDQLAASIDYACASIEIVGSRIRDWDIRITDTIADNASASHFVLGTEKVSLEQLDLIGCSMSMSKNDVVASEGVGAACLGNPLIAAQWLVRKMIEMGSPLQKGHIILAGALGPMVKIEPGDVFDANIEGLGNVHVQVSN